MTVLVTGASGNVGRPLCELLTAAGVDVRCADRAGSSAPDAGLEAVAFDFTDPATWAGAFRGIGTMFLVRPPALGNVRRDLLPSMAAARDAGVRHVVFLSLQGVERLRVVPHATVEAWLRTSGLEWTFVRPSFFTQNLTTTHASDVRDHDRIVVPAGRGRTAFVDTHDVASVAAAVLQDPATHRGRAYPVTGPEALDYAEVAAVLTAVLGRPITYTDPSVLSYLLHARRDLDMSWGMAALTAGIYTTARLGLAAGLTATVRDLTGREPTTVAETLRRESAAFSRPAAPAAPTREGES